MPGGGHGTQITFRVPHGCDGAATDTHRVQFPEGVTGVKPKWMAGWTIETEPTAPSRHGFASAPDASAAPGRAWEAEVGVVMWSGGPLPDSQYLDFQLLRRLPGDPRRGAYFPVVQRCGDVEMAWIEIPAEGQSEDDLEYPAPAVTIVAGEGHGA